jgi:hypothetical protein
LIVGGMRVRVDGERREDRLHRARRAEAVACRSLRRRDGRLRGVLLARASLITFVSLASPSGVEVPCALM